MADHNRTDRTDRLTRQVDEDLLDSGQEGEVKRQTDEAWTQDGDRREFDDRDPTRPSIHSGSQIVPPESESAADEPQPLDKKPAQAKPQTETISSEPLAPESSEPPANTQPGQLPELDDETTAATENPGSSGAAPGAIRAPAQESEAIPGPSTTLRGSSDVAEGPQSSQAKSVATSDTIAVGSVGLGNQDFSASVPTLTVADTTGNEDTAIPLVIAAALTDTDGSESLEVEIADVPSGATLSAGADNGDGTYSYNAKVDTAGTYFGKITNTGTWDAYGTQGRSVDAWNWELIITNPSTQSINFLLDTNVGASFVNVVPEPSSLVLLGMATGVVGLRRRRR